ncbi:MAG: SNF2-related protein, partial [Betaproteobacteria bacterium]
MKLLQNRGADRVIDLLRPHLDAGKSLAFMTPTFSLHAYAALRECLVRVDRTQLILPAEGQDLELQGGGADRATRNQLQTRWLANQCAAWLKSPVDVRRAPGRIPQGTAVLRNAQGVPERAILGSVALSTEGLGLTPANPLSLTQASETPAEAALLAQWFDQQWKSLPADSTSADAARETLLARLRHMGDHHAPFAIYALMLHHLFGNREDALDEERIVKSATGIRNTVVWKKLFKFQRDGVVGAIDKLARFGGCIIADSVGLGKTFEALAVIKYHELRNDRVLVLAPKRLRDNWTLNKANDKRNILPPHPCNYDEKNHTD